MTIYTFTRGASRTLFSGTGSTDWLGRPVLCDVGGGVWAMAYRQAAAHNNDGDGVVHIRFSTDEGANWSAVDTFTNGSGVTGAPFTPGASLDASDPLLITCPNGDLLLHVMEQTATMQGGTRQRRSTNGGASWSDEGYINSDVSILGGQDHKVIGADIYITSWTSQTNNQANPYNSQLYKSSNNGTTWTKVSDITSYAQNTNEPGLAYLGGTTLLAYLRDTGLTKSYARTSTDLGANWGTLTDITATVPAQGVMHRARFRQFGELLLVWGRDYLSGSSQQTELFFSTNAGQTWSAKCRPDLTTYTDTGYGDVLRRADGTFYMVNYTGSLTSASIVDYLFTIPGVASLPTALASMGVGGPNAIYFRPPITVNLQLAFDAQTSLSGLSNGTAISTWADISPLWRGGSARDASGSGGTRPTWDTANIAASFNGSLFMTVTHDAAIATGNNDYTMFVLAKLSNTVAEARCAIGKDDATVRGPALAKVSSSGAKWDAALPTFRDTISSATLTTNWTALAFRHEASAKRTSICVDSTIDSGTYTGTPSANTATFNIGMQRSGVSLFIGLERTILFYSAALSDVEMQAVCAYLRSWYGL